MKEHFLDRLYGEFQAYRASLLGCTNAEIFNRCYEIDAVVNFYEIMRERAERMFDCEMEILLKDKDLLTELYNTWLQKTDSTFMEMTAHVGEETGNIINRISGNRRQG